MALAQVAAKTSSAGTARVQVRTETSAGDAGSGASFSSTGLLEGVIDFGSGNAQLTTKLPTGDELESRSVDGVQYTRLPNPGGAQQDKPWLKIDLPEGARTGLGGLTDPTGGLVLLRDAGGPLTEIDRERVRDTATVHYRTELDVTKLPAPSPPAGTPGKPRPDTSGLLRRLLGDKPLPVEVWVDEQQRIRRLTLVLPIGNLTNAQPGTSSGRQPAPPRPASPAAPRPAPPSSSTSASPSTCSPRRPTRCGPRARARRCPAAVLPERRPPHRPPERALRPHNPSAAAPRSPSHHGPPGRVASPAPC